MRLGLLILFLSTWLAAPVWAQSVSVCAPPVVSSIHIAENTAGYSIDMEYPVLCQPVATRTVRDYVTSMLGEFKAEFPEHDLSEYPRKHEMMSEFAVWGAGQKRFASVKLQVMVYTGGAHPNHWPVTWVFDMKNGRVVKLRDIFADEHVALEAIVPMVREVLTQSLGEMAMPSMMESGIAPQDGNYDDFILNQEGIAFFFAPYQVAAYAAGQQVVTIPWELVHKYLSEEMKEALQEPSQLVVEIVK